MFLTMIFLAFQSFILISNSRHLLYRLCEFGKVKVTYKIIFRFILLFQVFKCFNVHKTHSFFPAVHYCRTSIAPFSERFILVSVSFKACLPQVQFALIGYLSQE